MKNDWDIILDAEAKERFAKKGFCIAYYQDEDIYLVQKIDDPQTWDESFTPPQLESDEQAKELAIAEGFEFDDPDKPYKVTNKV